jgi:hypothetical protein
MRSDEVVDIDRVRIDPTSEHPTAEAVAAGLETAADADEFNDAVGRKRIDSQMPTDLGFESYEGAPDVRSLIGRLIGAVELARPHEIDEIPRDRQRPFWGHSSQGGLGWQKRRHLNRARSQA